MHRYDIRDVWMALKLSAENFFIAMLVIWIGGIFILPFIVGIIEGEHLINADIKNMILKNENFIMILQALSLVIFIQSIIIYFTNRKYVIDLEEGIVTFPKSDIENSILEIFLLIPYWNLMQTKTVKCNEVENIYIDTKRWSTKHKVYTGTTTTGKSKFRTETKRHVRYTINIAGKFGSANLQFLDRQKRDEVRNAIQQCVKECTGKNIDRKVAEFN